MSKRTHMLKIKFLYFCKDISLFGEVTGGIWNEYNGKYFFLKIPTHLHPKLSILMFKIHVFDAVLIRLYPEWVSQSLKIRFVTFMKFVSLP